MKAILVINAPDNINFEKLERARISFYNKDTGNFIYRNARLKPMPKRFEPTIMTDYCLGNADGWNACIDEILGDDYD